MWSRFALFLACSRAGHGRGAAIATQLFAIAGVLLGIVALALGRGPRTESNDIYHRVMLAWLGAGLVLLFWRSGKAAR